MLQEGLQPMPAGPAEAGLLSGPARRIAVISEYPEVVREFELTALRHRVPISGDTSLESPKSPPQRLDLQIFGRGETHFPAGEAHFAAKVSVGKFRATV
jgi:hypothetical protein